MEKAMQWLNYLHASSIPYLAWKHILNQHKLFWSGDKGMLQLEMPYLWQIFTYDAEWVEATPFLLAHCATNGSSVHKLNTNVN